MEVVPDTPKAITLSCTDPRSRPLEYRASQPLHGSVSRPDAAGHVTYTPAAGYTGADAFAISADAGSASAPPVTVVLTVAAPPPAETTIASGPSGTVRSTSAGFGFTSSPPGATFRCRRDNSAWSACTSPQAYYGLSQGTHSFEVAAVNSAGIPDATPAKRIWKVDTVAPRVSTVSPRSASTGIAPTANVLATFSEAMQPSTVTKTTVKLVRKGTTRVVPAAVSYSASARRATLNPSAALARGAGYTATITTGAKDLAGNRLAAKRSWSFTTRR